MKSRYYVLVASLLLAGISLGQGESKYTNIPVIDKDGTHDWAFAIEQPEGWTAQGNVMWSYVPANPCSYFFSIARKQGPGFVAWASEYSFDFQILSNGTRLGKQMPERASDFLIEQANGFAKEGSIKILKREDTKTPFPYKPQIPCKTFSYHSTLSFEFTMNGKPKEAEFAYDFIGYIASAQSKYYGNWVAMNITSVIGEPGQLDQPRSVLNRALDTCKLNPSFLQAYTDTSKELFKKWSDNIARAKAAQAVVSTHRRAYDPDVFNASMDLRSAKTHLFSLKQELRTTRSHFFSYMEGN